MPPARNRSGIRLYFLATIPALQIGAIRFDEVMFPLRGIAKDKAWQPGPYEGVELMILHKNESTGGVVVLRKFKAGCAIPAHMASGRQ